MTHITCRLTAKNRDQLRNPIRSVIEYGLPLPFIIIIITMQRLTRRVSVIRMTNRRRKGALPSLKQVRVEPRPLALNTTLPAFAAERRHACRIYRSIAGSRRPQLSVDICYPRSAANAAASVDRRNRQTDGHPAADTMCTASLRLECTFK